MELKQLTRDSVIRAIGECDRLGRDRFLDENGFREALEYYLLYGGRVYDSKAITGVAYRYDTGTSVSSVDFTGGRAVAERLEALGFTITLEVDWQWSELLLACDLVNLNGWAQAMSSRDDRVIDLSQFLRSQRPELEGAPRFRSPSSVHRKLEDLRTAHPSYGGQRTRGGRLTADVVAAFAAEPDRMHQLAQALRAVGLRDESNSYEHPTDVGRSEDRTGETIASSLEGQVLRRLVTTRERDPKLRNAKIDQSRSARGDISCEICGFDFEKVYGDLGAGYIHVHHVIPLHFSGQVNTTLDDLILVCVNCHQMIHRDRSRWKTPEELRQIIKTTRNQ